MKHHRKYERREQYIKDAEAEFKPVTLSLDNTIEVDGEEVIYLDTVASEYDLEKDVISRESIVLLKQSLSTLNKEKGIVGVCIDVLHVLWYNLRWTIYLL